MSGLLARHLEAALAQDRARLADAQSGEDVPGPLLAGRAAELAARLRQHGIRPDEPVHLRIGNRPDDLAAMLGIWLAGGVAVPIHLSAAPNTLQTTGEASRARFAVDAGRIEIIGEAPPPARALLDGAALIIFTSGTTGRPKGVVLGHAALAGKFEVLGRMLALRPQDWVLLPLQLTFIFGIWVAFVTLQAGARLSLIAKFSKPGIEASLAAGATVLAAVPSMFRILLVGPHPAAPSLRLVLTGGEALGPALSQRLASAWPSPRIYDLYGSTETGSCDFRHVAGSAANTIGVPTEGVEFRIAEGELQIRTPFGMAGYLDHPELSLDAFSEGYFRSGDLARALPDGGVSVIGRLKEIVSRGGNKIAPQEIDDLLCAHPSVAASLTAGMPDARLGESMHSVVVAMPGREVAGETLKAWLAERVERYKLPETIRRVGELPTGPTGKASRAVLREMLVAGTLEPPTDAPITS